MNITNDNNLPKALVDACTDQHGMDPHVYSVTELHKGELEIVLTRIHADEICIDVSDMVFALFGTVAHRIIAESDETGDQFKETKIEMPLGRVGIRGTFDLYDDSLGEVVDWKTATTWKVIYDEWDDYREQLLSYVSLLNIYCGFKNARRGKIVALLKDFSKTKAERDSSYPRHPIVVKIFEFSDDEMRKKLAYMTEKARLVDALVRSAEKDGWFVDSIEPCTPEQRWQKQSKYAVMKKGRKSAVRLFDQLDDAENMISENFGGSENYTIEHRTGEDMKCLRYCQVNKFCPYFAKTYGMR